MLESRQYSILIICVNTIAGQKLSKKDKKIIYLQYYTCNGKKRYVIIYEKVLNKKFVLSITISNL